VKLDGKRLVVVIIDASRLGFLRRLYDVQCLRVVGYLKQICRIFCFLRNWFVRVKIWFVLEPFCFLELMSLLTGIIICTYENMGIDSKISELIYLSIL